MADAWVEYTPPSKFTKLTEPGQAVRGKVVNVLAGKFGPEVTLELEDGTHTTLSCSPAMLAAWAEVVGPGEVWEVKFEGTDQAKGDKSGMRRFKFRQKVDAPNGVNADGVPF